MPSSDVRAFRKLRAVAFALLAIGVSALGTVAAPAQAATTVTVSLRTAIRNLPVVAETPVGYQRTKFKLWIDANGDCQNTRAEVLIAESRVPTTGGCTIETGRWFSYYDRATWTNASDVDIDHLVPLAEAWASGAKTWNADTRMRYANDLRDPRTLVAVTDNVNEAKGDQDPAQWLPTYGTCRYVREWTAVKLRWSLKVDKAEKAKLAQVAARLHQPHPHRHQGHHRQSHQRHRRRHQRGWHQRRRRVGPAVPVLLPGQGRGIRPVLPGQRPRVLLVHRQRPRRHRLRVTAAGALFSPRG